MKDIFSKSMVVFIILKIIYYRGGKMFKVCEIDEDLLEEIIQEKLRVGQEEYGDEDVDRYSPYDILEEFADSINIASRLIYELKQYEEVNEFEQDIIDGENEEFMKLMKLISKCINQLQEVDEGLSDKVRNDSACGERIAVGDINNLTD